MNDTQHATQPTFPPATHALHPAGQAGFIPAPAERGRGHGQAFHVSRLAPHAWLVIAVTALNLALTSYIAVSHLEPFADLATYYQEAQMLAQGKGFTQPIKINVHTAASEAPFPTSDRFMYPMLVAVAIKLLGDSLGVANFVAAASMALTALPLYALGKKLFDARAALLATIFFALNPFYHAIGIQGWTDLTATLLYYICLLCLADYYFSPTSGGAFLSGVLLALAALTREESIMLALPLVVIWWWRGRERKHALMFTLAPLAGFLLRALYLQQSFGNPFYSERPYFFLPRWGLWYYLGSFNPQEYLDYVGGIQGALGIRVYNLLRFVIDHFSDGLLYFTGMGMLPLSMLLAVAAAWRSRLSHDQRALIRLFAGLMLLQILVGLGYPGYIDNGQAVRHGSFASPFILLVASAGLIAWWQRSRLGRLVAALVTANYLLFAVAYLGLWGLTLTRPDYRGPIVLAAEWAREHLADPAVVMTRRAAETYYFSGKSVVVTPSAPFAELMAFARAHHITHFLISEVERSGTPNLLQGMRAYPENFQTVYSTEGAQLVAVTSDEFPAPLALPDELYAGKTIGRPARLFDWNDLRPDHLGAVFEVLTGAWGQLFDRALHPPAPLVPRGESVNLTVGALFTLVRYEIANVNLQADEDVQVTLHWQAAGRPLPNYTVFVHLLDSAGLLRAQKDSPPLNGTRPTAQWQRGEWIEDHYSFTVPDNLPPGHYALEIGVYDPMTGERLPLCNAAKQCLDERRLLIHGLVVR